MRRAVLEHPDPRLRTVAQPVTTFDGELSQLVDDLLETMYEIPSHPNIKEVLVSEEVVEQNQQPLRIYHQKDAAVSA